MRLLVYLGKVLLLAAALPLLAGAAKTTGTSTSATSRPVRAPRRRSSGGFFGPYQGRGSSVETDSDFELLSDLDDVDDLRGFRHRVRRSGRRQGSSGLGVSPTRRVGWGAVPRHGRERTRFLRSMREEEFFGARVPAVNTGTITAALCRRVVTALQAVEQASSLASSSTKILKREVKVAVSGEWEGALLKLTWPDDKPPDEDLVSALVHAVRRFRRDRDVTKRSAQHRVVLRKLWAKMAEDDWRTVAKAALVLHCIARAVSVDQHAVLKTFIGKMSRERFKKTEFNYFDLDVLSDVDEEGEAFSSFLDRYGTFVVKRAEGYDAGFQEVEKVDHEDGWEHAVTALEKAQETIDLGLACKPGRREENKITVLCLRETAMDLRELWQRYRSALTWFLAEAGKGTRFDGVDSAVLTECLGGFERSCKARYDEVTAFLLGAEEVIGSYGLEVPDLSLPPAHLPDPQKPSSAPASPAAAAEVDPPAEAASAINERTATDTAKRVAAKAKAYRESRSSATAGTKRRTGTRTKSTKKLSSISGKESPTSTTGSSGSASTSSSSSVDRSTTASTTESDAKAGGTPMTHAARSTIPTEGLQGGNETRGGR